MKNALMSLVDELWQINTSLSLVTAYKVHKSEIIVTHVTIMALALGLLKIKKNPLHCAVYLLESKKKSGSKNIRYGLLKRKKKPLEIDQIFLLITLLSLSK